MFVSVEDTASFKVFAIRSNALTGQLFMAERTPECKNLSGSKAIEPPSSLTRARGVRYVGPEKDGLLVSAVRREQEAIRSVFGIAPFCLSPSSNTFFFSLTAALVKVQLPQNYSSMAHRVLLACELELFALDSAL